nr:MAG TPA: hypothetical protein [Caudoviricetes sp.]
MLKWYQEMCEKQAIHNCATLIVRHLIPLCSIFMNN